MSHSGAGRIIKTRIFFVPLVAIIIFRISIIFIVIASKCILKQYSGRPLEVAQKMVVAAIDCPLRRAEVVNTNETIFSCAWTEI